MPAKAIVTVTKVGASSGTSPNSNPRSHGVAAAEPDQAEDNPQPDEHGALAEHGAGHVDPPGAEGDADADLAGSPGGRVPRSAGSCGTVRGICLHSADTASIAYPAEPCKLLILLEPASGLEPLTC